MYYVVYGFLYLISLLPFGILYFIGNLIYIILYYVIGYRKDVVMGNLKIAFPKKTENERIIIAKQFYRNLTDSFIETIKMFSLNKNKFLKRCNGNFKVVNDLAEKGKNVNLHGAHQFNWEYANWIYAMKINLVVASVYMPIKNKILNKIFIKIRGRFGAIMVDSTNYQKKMISVARQQHALALVADQNPALPAKSYWLNFFKRPVPFLPGPEKGARRNNNAVVFVKFIKVKKGYYYYENHVVTEDAAECKPGEITRKFRDFIQDAITEAPANFLWSHRKWRHEYKDDFKKMWIDNLQP
jgi:KDO2-lipid IV(A) lauroyltransferase